MRKYYFVFENAKESLYHFRNASIEFEKKSQINKEDLRIKISKAQEEKTNLIIMLLRKLKILPKKYVNNGLDIKFVSKYVVLEENDREIINFSKDVESNQLIDFIKKIY